MDDDEKTTPDGTKKLTPDPRRVCEVHSDRAAVRQSFTGDGWVCEQCAENEDDIKGGRP